MVGDTRSDGAGRAGEAGDLFAELRRVKDAAQLSYNRLAEKTHYSRSSWERFLNAKQVPSRIAVEEFAAAAGVDPAPLLALWERTVAAEGPPSEEPRRAKATAAAAPPVAAPASPVGAPRHRRRNALQLAVGILAGALLGSLSTFLITGASDVSTADGTSPAAAPGPEARGAAHASRPAKVGCKSDTCLYREPQAEDCHWDAVTVRGTYLRGMRIQLRYSAACQAVWGRIENGNIGDTVTIKDKRSNSDSATIRMEHDTYTRMLAVSPDATWETVTICGAIPSQKEQECEPLGTVGP
jgi:transcriptional regulator with XRE-family HTH domain